MKQIFLLISLELFICMSYAQVGNQYNSYIFFLNKEVGWMNWQNTPYRRAVIKTTDGGITWNDAHLPIKRLWQVLFINKKIGFIVGIQDTVWKLFKTFDGGDKWQLINSHKIIGWLSFLNDTLGYALKYQDPSYDILIRTTDGGETWNNIDTLPGSTLNIFIHGVDDITYSGGYHDSGQNETFGFVKRTKGEQYTHNFSFTFSGVHFVDSLRGFGGTSKGRLYKTTDGGLSWGIVSEVPAYIEYISEVFFTDSLHGFFSNPYNLSKTTDGGITWIPNIHPTSYDRQRSYLDSMNIFEAVLYTNPILFYKSTDGGYTWKEFPVNFTTSVNENSSLKDYSLAQNYPNPFNPTTTIKYSLAEAGRISLSVYDILGREITKLIDEEKPAGEYQTTWYASAFSSGVYFLKMKSGEFTETKKLILIK